MDAETVEFPNLPDRLKGLGDLAENLWWSWHPSARMLFKLLDRQAWKESGHNPDKMLREMPAEILNAAAANDGYLRNYDLVLSRFHRYLSDKSCRFLDNFPYTPGTYAIAYFSAEYGLHRSLPFYAGGLGFLAGDHIKECSDLGVPLVAVGFMYPQGYLHQQIRGDGWQENIHETIDRDAAPILRELDKTGRQLVIQVPFIEPPIHVGIWRVNVGRISLYLLDTDIEENDPWNRSISARLYIGDIEQRLRQEIVLGIGGAEVLQTLGIQHHMMHLNEGHAAFALLERIRDRIQERISYRQAVEQVKNTTIFTTHTPVPAGHDVIPFYLMEKYFHAYWPALNLDRDGFLQLGIHPDQPNAGFNLTAFALKMSAYRNGVSKRHGEVSRKMWRSLWPEIPGSEIPVAHITNGVHVPTWIDPRMKRLFDTHLDPEWLADHDNPLVWELIDKIPNETLWRTHYWLKIKLIDAIRERSRCRWAEDHVSPSIMISGGTLLDPSVLTLGFARRFATYKRADLLFYDMKRLKKLLNDRWRPIQIIFAGKAHPADDPGKQIIQKVFNAARDPETGGRIAFVEDYGEQLAQYMVHGVDVWLNSPLPPMEASGTSGMKAALNGVPQLSIMDGWWIEGYNGKNGWAFNHKEIAGAPDAADAAEVYRILEEEVVPLYYKVSEDGVPMGWVNVMKNSIKSNAAKFSARRMVKEYIKKFYAEGLAFLGNTPLPRQNP